MKFRQYLKRLRETHLPIMASNPVTDAAKALQHKQRKILSLKWANFGRFTPSNNLAENLNQMYDKTVIQLKHELGNDVHVSQVDAEAWDEFWTWFNLENDFPPLGIHVTHEQALHKKHATL